MCYRSSSSVILINYSCVHNQIATFGLFSRQSVTLDIGLNIGCSHHRDNRPSEQSAKCTIGQALVSTQASFLANATNKSQLIAMIRTKFQHHGMSLRCLKIMEAPQRTLLVLERNSSSSLIVQTLDKHCYTCYHRSIRRSLLSYSF